jgi:3D (Asp-Asp-Asp) domain-containing protein
MKHTTRRKPSVRGKATFKHLAAVFSGAVAMSAMMLPGIPLATVHAAVNPNSNSSQRTSKNSRLDDNLMLQSSAGNKLSGNLQFERNMNQMGKPVSPIPNASEQANTLQPKISGDQAHNQVELNNAEAKPTKPDGEKSSSSETTTPTDFKKVVETTATAYTSGSKDNDQWADKTYTGTKIRPGVIAVDPGVIPLGSQVYLKYPDGHGAYAIAEDTGGAIKGNRIDVVKSTEHEASDFGVQKVKVYVVKSPSEA